MDKLDVKITVRRGRKVVAIISDADMAEKLLGDQYPEAASLFAELQRKTEIVQEAEES